MAENKNLISEGRFEIIVKRYEDGSQVERHNTGISDSELVSLAEVVKAEALARILKTTKTEFFDKEMD